MRESSGEKKWHQKPQKRVKIFQKERRTGLMLGKGPWGWKCVISLKEDFKLAKTSERDV